MKNKLTGINWDEVDGVVQSDDEVVVFIGLKDLSEKERGEIIQNSIKSMKGLKGGSVCTKMYQDEECNHCKEFFHCDILSGLSFMQIIRG